VPPKQQWPFRITLMWSTTGSGSQTSDTFSNNSVCSLAGSQQHNRQQHILGVQWLYIIISGLNSWTHAVSKMSCIEGSNSHFFQSYGILWFAGNLQQNSTKSNHQAQSSKSHCFKLCDSDPRWYTFLTRHEFRDLILEFWQRTSCITWSIYSIISNKIFSI
jgi:hypothetical protein